MAPAPAFDAAAMDGYAVAGAGPWRVVGQVLAGGPTWTGRLTEGCAVEIATGAVVPAGASAVLPYERCERDDGTLRGSYRQNSDHIRRAGEDVQPGDELVPAGRVVSAAVLGAAAQAGIDDVSVHPRPRVCLLVTGDEVVPDTAVPGLGQVRDAMSPMVAALVGRAGGDLVERRLLGDGAVLLRTAIAAAKADLVVVTGSSSVGTADHLRGALDRLGAHWHVDGVQCRPGHPQALATTADGRWVVGLPGNPFAALAAALTILEPAVAALAGRPPQVPLELPVLGEARLLPHGVRLAPVTLLGGQARIVPGGRSGSLRAAAVADALAVLEPDWTSGTPAALLPVP
jgi:molybdopterin molybdotransferase